MEGGSFALELERDLEVEVVLGWEGFLVFKAGKGFLCGWNILQSLFEVK